MALRWITRVAGVVYAAIGAFAMIMVISGQARGPEPNISVWLYVGEIVILVGLVVAIFWKGIGEVAGGLAMIVGAVIGAFGMPPFLWIVTAVGVLGWTLIGLAFIVCGWHMLAYEHHGPAHPTA